MPVIRSGSSALYLDMHCLSLADSMTHREIAHDEFSLRKRAAARQTPYVPPSPVTPVAKPAKKKKAPNAFILYRSYVIANKLLSKDITHQNDVSRLVGDMWKAVDDETRAHFYKLADEEKIRFRAEEGLEPIETRRKRTHTSRPSQRKLKQVAARMPTPPASPESQLPASPMLSTTSSSPGWFHSELQYPTPEISTTSLPSPPTEMLPSVPLSAEPIFFQSEPYEPLFDFEWSAASPTSSLSLLSCEASGNALELDLGDASYASEYGYFDACSSSPPVSDLSSVDSTFV